MISLENDNGGSESKREADAVVEYARHETETNQMMPPTRLESSATSASEWPDFTGAAAKSPTRQSRPDDLFSMLMMEPSDKESSPPLQSSESSGQSSADSSRPPVGSRSYSRELLSMFLDQATSNEEEALTYAMKQPDLSPRTTHESDARKKKSTRKKKRDSSSSRSKHTILDDDWSDWRKTNKAIDSMLKSPVLSLSTGDTTPRSNNVAKLPVIVSPNVTTPSSFGGPRSLGPQDAVSVHSDLTSCFTPSDNLCNKTQELQQVSKEKEIQKLAKEKEERELDAIVEKARILSLGPTVRQPKPKKTVRFDNVQVRKYQRILSCNPSCTAGPPVGLGWKYTPSQTYDINRFETHRHPQRRAHRQLLMSRPIREDLLRDLGYTDKDLATAVRQSIKTRNQRKQTVTNLGAARVEERIENAGRRVKSLFGRGVR